MRELAEQQMVRSVTQFPGGASFSYCLQQEAELTAPQATFTDQQITVSLPAAMANQWANSNDISLRGSSPLSDNEELTILVEKDFKCLTDRPHEDESDLFPHPKQGDLAC